MAFLAAIFRKIAPSCVFSKPRQHPHLIKGCEVVSASPVTGRPNGRLEILMLVGEVVVFYPAGDPIGIARFLRNDTEHLYPAFQRALQMLSMWVMSWDFDRTNQPLAFDQLGP